VLKVLLEMTWSRVNTPMDSEYLTVTHTHTHTRTPAHHDYFEPDAAR
jgi:hypothetical protein